MLYDLQKKCRSYRRFDVTKRISRDELVSFVECARLTPSAGNLQRLRYKLVTDEKTCDEIFDTLKFAAYLKDWSGPAECERPAAYIIIASMAEADVNLSIDIGICAEAIALSAAEQGIGYCMFRSFSKEKVSAIALPEGIKPHLVMAFGYPSETVLLSDAENGDIKYFRDHEDRHITPKLPLDTLLLD